MILVNTKVSGDTILEISDILLANILDSTDRENIKTCITSSSVARAGIIFEGTKTGFKDALFVISFSSRGSNSVSQGILKPNIIGPRLNILATWPSLLKRETLHSTSSLKP